MNKVYVYIFNFLKDYLCRGLVKNYYICCFVYYILKYVYFCFIIVVDGFFILCFILF